MADPALIKGQLGDGVVPELLREIYVGRLSGVLNLVRGEERQSLRFRRGHIANAHTNVVEERMGELLVRRGLLSQEGFDRATEVVIRDRRRLGEVLEELGLLDASGLEDAVALHVHELLAKVFSWTGGSYEFEPSADDDAADGALTLKLSTGELILDAVRAVRDPRVVHEALGDMDRVLAPSSDPLLRFQKLTLTPADGFVLSRVDGSTTAREIVQMIPMPAEDVERSLFGLLSTGAIEYHAASRRPREAAPRAAPPAPAPAAPEPPPMPSPAPAASAVPRREPPQTTPVPVPVRPPEPTRADEAPPAQTAEAAPALDERTAERRREIHTTYEGRKRMTHFEVLGLPRSASEADVKEAYFRLAKRFHPDAHHDAALADLRDELEAVFIRLGEAYEALKDPRRRAEYESRLGRPRPGAPPPQPSAPEARTQAGPRADPPPAAASPAAEAAAGDAEQQARAHEEAIRKASWLFEREKYFDAIQLLEPVVDTGAGAAPKTLQSARVLLARCYVKNPNWWRRAEETLLACTRDEPRAADAWALLGWIYAQKGLQLRALGMYRKALEVRPDHEEATQYLAEHPGTEAPQDEPPPDEGGGFFRKLFGKG